jgi:hypothetical protein
MGASPSSRLIAACYVLHRLRTPRHPPDALALTLDRSALVSHARRRTQDMERDHWIEILRSTGVQTGQSRLHCGKEQDAGKDQEIRPAYALCLFRRGMLRSMLALVEPIGIEPTTSSLQSSRSPN